MKTVLGAAVAAVLVAGSSASAQMSSTLQLDINGIAVQAQNGGGVNSAFGGLTHTGSLNFDFAQGITHLLGVFVQHNHNAPVNMGFNGDLSNFNGVINLNNGQVMGGSLMVTVNGTDTYSAQITPGVGSVTTFVGGGYKVEGLTFNGLFSGSTFGNVDVSPWYDLQTIVGGHPGSFLSFNFNPNATGASYADMDVFVEVIPLPPAAWTGLATLAGVMFAGYMKRRR
jgi:hypothetical protein